MKKRIWELDALRGICVLGMVIVHFVYDLVVLYRLVQWNSPPAFLFVQRWGGVLFVLISGICVTLGSHRTKRGILVFSCGLVCSAVTAGMYFLKLSGPEIIIYFGVLHCLGLCMLLWQPLRNWPAWALLILGLTLCAAGFWLQAQPPVDFPWLIPLGLKIKGFMTSDYFPLLPNFGFFLLGGVLGKTLYRKKESLLPQWNPNQPVLRFFRWCGLHSLWIYLLHQPVLNAVFYLILWLK